MCDVDPVHVLDFVNLYTYYTLQTKMDPDSGYPLDELSPLAQQLFVSQGCNCTKVSEILARKPHVVYHAIKKGLARVSDDVIMNTSHKVSSIVYLVYVHLKLRV